MVIRMTDIDSIIAVVIGSIIAMGGLLALATMMEQWMKRDPLADRAERAVSPPPPTGRSRTSTDLTCDAFPTAQRGLRGCNRATRDGR